LNNDCHDHRSEQKRHFQLKHRILEGSGRLADDHQRAGREQDQQRPPDEGKEAGPNAIKRLIDPDNPDQSQVEHQRRGNDDGNRQDVNRLHRRDDPTDGLDGLAQRYLIEPDAKAIDQLRHFGPVQS
jgi:hypothetical protein